METNKKLIPVFKPSMGEEEVSAIKEVINSGWIGLGPKTKEFEEKFAKYIGTKYAVALNSATAALHLSLKVLNIEGGEVITTPMTFVSTNHAILYNNATPVFCDIEPDTLNIDCNKIEKLITPKTKAIIVVHFGGYPVDMDRVMEIAKKNNLFVIEDTAHGCGGEYKSSKLGSIGTMGCFSFHAVKNLATGDGGMITTNDLDTYKKLLKLRWLGISKDTWSREDGKKYSWEYNVEELGFKCHMNDLNAAIGMVQLAKLDLMNKKRQEISERYTKELSLIEGIETPVIKSYATKPAFHNYVIKTQKRDALFEYLASNQISAGVHYIPNNNYEMYKEYKGETPVAKSIWEKLLTLPLYPDMTEEDTSRVINTVKEFFNK
jgi:perosamine synthetase